MAVDARIFTKGRCYNTAQRHVISRMNLSKFCEITLFSREASTATRGISSPCTFSQANICSQTPRSSPAHFTPPPFLGPSYGFPSEDFTETEHDSIDEWKNQVDAQNSGDAQEGAVSGDSEEGESKRWWLLRRRCRFLRLRLPLLSSQRIILLCILHRETTRRYARGNWLGGFPNQSRGGVRNAHSFCLHSCAVPRSIRLWKVGDNLFFFVCH